MDHHAITEVHADMRDEIRCAVGGMEKYNVSGGGVSWRYHDALVENPLSRCPCQRVDSGMPIHPSHKG